MIHKDHQGLNEHVKSNGVIFTANRSNHVNVTAWNRINGAEMSEMRGLYYFVGYYRTFTFQKANTILQLIRSPPSARQPSAIVYACDALKFSKKMRALRQLLGLPFHPFRDTCHCTGIAWFKEHRISDTSHVNHPFVYI